MHASLREYIFRRRNILYERVGVSKKGRNLYPIFFKQKNWRIDTIQIGLFLWMDTNLVVLIGVLDTGRIIKVA
mgnify:CR=1 FL=1